MRANDDGLYLVFEGGEERLVSVAEAVQAMERPGSAPCLAVSVQSVRGGSAPRRSPILRTPNMPDEVLRRLSDRVGGAA